MYFARLAAAGKDRVYFFTGKVFIYDLLYNRLTAFRLSTFVVSAIWDLVSGFMRMRVYCAGAAPNIELVYSCDLV